MGSAQSSGKRRYCRKVGDGQQAETSMIEAILVVLTNPIPGREADFNDWYTNVPTRDALRFRGSIAQQRFSFAHEQVWNYPNGFIAKYLALYEVYDAARFSQEHVDNALTTRMVVEN